MKFAATRFLQSSLSAVAAPKALGYYGAALRMRLRLGLSHRPRRGFRELLARGDETMKPTALLPLLLLAWASCGFAQPAPQQPPSAHVWRQSQKTDAANTLTFTRFTLVGKFLTPPHDQVANRPALAVDCIPPKGSHPSKAKYLAANLLVGTTLKIIYVEPEEIRGTSYLSKVAVRYRTDAANEDEAGNWSPGREKTSVAVPKDALKKILRARTVAITAVDNGGSEIAMQFDMPDPTAVEDGCNVDEK
jgi:hypothetical protein